jgi:hypothetical protein
MDEEKSILKILKWAGIVALIAVPVFVYLKKKHDESQPQDRENEMDIFSTELEK